MSLGRLHPGLIKSRYPQLRGRDWLRRIDLDDRRALSGLGRSVQTQRGLNWHSEGGKIRAWTAERDQRGRFVAKGQRKGE